MTASLPPFLFRLTRSPRCVALTHRPKSAHAPQRPRPFSGRPTTGPLGPGCSRCDRLPRGLQLHLSPRVDLAQHRGARVCLAAHRPHHGRLAGEYDAELKGFYATVAKAYPWAAESGLFALPKVCEGSAVRGSFCVDACVPSSRCAADYAPNVVRIRDPVHIHSRKPGEQCV